MRSGATTGFTANISTAQLLYQKVKKTDAKIKKKACTAADAGSSLPGTMQSGGEDDILNMNPLDQSVNRSLGVQEYPNATRSGEFNIK